MIFGQALPGIVSGVALIVVGMVMRSRNAQGERLGRCERFNDRAEGRAEGLAQGREEGRREGRRELLDELATKRFLRDAGGGPGGG